MGSVKGDLKQKKQGIEVGLTSIDYEHTIDGRGK
jgi:hypothetical protein